MNNKYRLDPEAAAKKFVLNTFANCQGALLAGSVIRGEATSTSDLDIVVFDKNLSESYRESLTEYGWPIELFVHNLTSYRQFFEADAKRARPTLPKMVSEGIILVNDGSGFIESVKLEAIRLLEKGPEPWTEQTITIKRYFITDALLDFTGSTSRAEDIFIANTLAEILCEFILRTNNKWVGSSKWTIRALKMYDPALTARFVEAFDIFYKTGQKQLIESLTIEILQPYGGMLFEGFSLGKKQ